MNLDKQTKYQDKRTRRYIYITDIEDGFVKIQYCSNNHEALYSFKEFNKFFRKVWIVIKSPGLSYRPGLFYVTRKKVQIVEEA